MTGRGIAAAVAGAVLVVLSRVLGIFDLLVLGTALLLTVAGALVWVYARLPSRVTVVRTLRPALVQAGGECRVELVLHAGRRSGTLVVRDRLRDGSRQIGFWCASLGSGEERRSHYRLPADRRGRIVIGPAVAIRRDPLGFASRRIARAADSELVVAPAAAPIAPLPATAGLRMGSEPHAARARGSGGDEFAGLAAYVPGDDLRRVHWPSSARSGDLLVRVDAAGRTPASVLVLDDRSSSHLGESFERALEIVAGACAATLGRQPVVVRTWSGRELGRIEREDGLLEVLAALAALAPTDDHRSAPPAVPAGRVPTGRVGHDVDVPRGAVLVGGPATSAPGGDVWCITAPDSPTRPTAEVSVPWRDGAGRAAHERSVPRAR